MLDGYNSIFIMLTVALGLRITWGLNPNASDIDRSDPNSNKINVAILKKFSTQSFGLERVTTSDLVSLPTFGIWNVCWTFMKIVYTFLNLYKCWSSDHFIVYLTKILCSYWYYIEILISKIRERKNIEKQVRLVFSECRSPNLFEEVDSRKTGQQGPVWSGYCMVVEAV